MEVEDDFGGLGVEAVKDTPASAEAKADNMLGVGLRPVGAAKPIPRSASKKGEVDESAISGFRKLMRNTSMKMGLGGGGGGGSASKNSKNMDKRNSSRKFIRGIGSRKELFEANDVEVNKDGEFTTKPRRQSTAAIDTSKVPSSPPKKSANKHRSSMRRMSSQIGLPPLSAAAAKEKKGGENDEEGQEDDEEEAERKRQMQGGFRASFRKFSRTKLNDLAAADPEKKTENDEEEGEEDEDEEEAKEREKQKQGGFRSSFRNFSRTKLEDLGLVERRDSEPDLGLVDVNPEDTLAKRAKEMERDGTQKHSKAYSKIAVQRATSYSAPALIQAPFGQSWSRDILSLAHNAIKEELSETYYLMSVLNRMFTELEMDDIQMFFSHWETTHKFLAKYFEVEEKAVFTRLAKKCTITGPLGRKERAAARSEMLRTMQVLKVDFDSDLVFLPPSEALSVIKKKIDTVVGKLSNYMMQEFVTLPPVFEQHFMEADKDLIESDFVGDFFCDDDGCLVHILLKWVKDPTWRKYLLTKHFDRRSMKVLLDKGKQYQREHTNIVKKLNNRSKVVVVEMLEADFAAESVPDFYRNQVDTHFEEEWEYYSEEEEDGAKGAKASEAAAEKPAQEKNPPPKNDAEDSSDDDSSTDSDD